MRVGYCVPCLPNLASYRLRVAVPAPFLGCEYVIGKTGKPSFFFKDGFPDLAYAIQQAGDGVVYDVVNDHFNRPQYRDMCKIADALTCSSEAMADTVKKHTGRLATVIDDPYENNEGQPTVSDGPVLWFGHQANLKSLSPYATLTRLRVCTGSDWTAQNERLCLDECGMVLLTGANPGASTNRIAKAIRAGRFVVTPGGIPSWEQFRPYAWIGDVETGIQWANDNREEACSKIRAGQKYVSERFSPSVIGQKWKALFASI